MDLLFGTIGDVLHQLDHRREELLKAPTTETGRHAKRVTLPSEGVFYVETAQPGSSVAVSFVQPQDAATPANVSGDAE